MLFPKITLLNRRRIRALFAAFAIVGAASFGGVFAALFAADGTDSAASTYEIGSDAFLDAASADVFRRRAEDAVGEDEIDLELGPKTIAASSGFDRRTKKTKTTGLFGYDVETSAKDGDTFYERWIEADSSAQIWTKQILPQGLIYPSYLAGRKEARFESVVAYDDRSGGTFWDATLGGRVPIFRFGTTDPVQPEGWEVELEGAAFLRLDLERGRNDAATEYRAGVPIVYGTKRWQLKTGYYHAARLDDRYLTDDFRIRDRYSRDAATFGLAFKPTPDVRFYAEFGYAFRCGGTAEPFDVQFGFEYSPPFDPNYSNKTARPFFATRARLYEERDFGGYWATQIGVQWRSAANALLRLGGEVFVGGDDSRQFYQTYQRKVGLGLWYDF